MDPESQGKVREKSEFKENNANVREISGIFLKKIELQTKCQTFSPFFSLLRMLEFQPNINEAEDIVLERSGKS